MLVGGEPGPWGPTTNGGRRWRLLTRVTVTLTAVALVAVAAVATTGLMLVQKAEANLTRVPVPELENSVASTDARHFLLVGSDARDGLADEDRQDLTLGSFDGQRSDTIIYVSISADRSAVSLVSLPRDLLVLDDDRQRKLTDTFAGGPTQLVRIIRENFGLPVNHFVQISLGGFIDAVRTLGGVDICLDDPLVDPKSGADLEAGCQRLDAGDALAYVRSRSGTYGDYERIDRQQRFLRSVLSEMTDLGRLANPGRLVQLVEDLSSNVTTDEHLSINHMRGLAGEMREVIRDDVPMGTVPAYPRSIDNVDYMIAYRPGADAMFEALREGDPLPDPGTRDDRTSTGVYLLSGGRGEGVNRVDSTLRFSGFDVRAAGWGPESMDAGETTTVLVIPGEEERAGWVAAVLGAPQEPLPEGLTVPENVQVVVAVGDDAAS